MDEIFDNYLSRPGVRQPILTQYCDGRQVQCLNRGWMTQWGSCSLGERGYSPIEILRHYYGDSLYINTAEEIAGIPSSWPGYDLTIGASGQKVRAASGAAGCDRHSLHRHPPRVAARRHLRTGHRRCRAGVPVHLRPAPDRRHGFCDVV